MVVAFVCSGNNKGIILLNVLFYIEGPSGTIPAEAIKESMRLMNGHKADLFILQLSFIGWTILGLITVIGFIWVIPYINTSIAAFYEQLRNKDTGSLNTVTE